MIFFNILILAYIKEYLCIAPHDRKFCLDATREVLHRSVETKEDFSAYRATQAWSAIAAYAHNLLAQPWRKEFHEIKVCFIFSYILKIKWSSFSKEYF